MTRFRVLVGVAGERFAFEPGDVVTVPEQLDAATAAAWCQCGTLAPEPTAKVEEAVGPGARRGTGR